MKKNQKGAIDLMLAAAIIAVVAVGGLVIWRIYDQSKDSKKDSASNLSTAQQNSQNETQDETDDNEQQTEGETENTDNKNSTDTSALKSGEVRDVETIALAKAGDESKLPSYVPASFVTHIATVLKNNTPTERGCISVYNVHKISSVNIRGGIGSAAADTLQSSDSCGGGAALVWSIQDDGSWEQTGFQQTPACKTLEEKRIGIEFVPECYTGEISNPKLIANPNGSITNFSQ